MEEEEAIKILNELSTYDAVKLENGDEAIEVILKKFNNLKKDYKDLEKEISDFRDCWLHKSKMYQEIDRLEMELKLYNKDVDEYNYYSTLDIIETLKRLLGQEE